VLTEVIERLDMLTARCGQAMRSQHLEYNQRLNLMLAHMENMRYRILQEAQRVDGAVARMREALRARLQHASANIYDWTHALMARSPAIQVRRDRIVVPQLQSRLTGAMSHGLKWRAQQTHGYLARLHSLSPLAILDRGYGILEMLPQRQVIRDAGQVSVGEKILARVARGQLRCTVEEVTVDSSVSKPVGTSL
jgi:exodeoxyribonuclease VII large subunit